jgi:ABC-2 type transport system ATP-binding protein
MRGVTKRYGTLAALSDVTFSIEQGEAVGYLGPNGSGKTTTLKLFSGLTRPDGGEVRVAGHDIRSARKMALSKIGVLVETPGILPYVSGMDLLNHVAEVKGVPLNERPSAVNGAASSLGVKDQLGRPLGSLSTGLLRRILLAAAMVGDPAILLLDEPTLGLDPAARADLRVTLRGLHEKGTTIFLTTHLIEDVEEVCGRVLFLRDGRIAGDEAVSPVGSHEGTGRAIIVKTVDPVDLAAATGLIGNTATAERRSERELVIRFPGGDAAQSDILRSLVTGGVRVVGVAPLGPDLAARYMTTVGREEAV